MMAYLRLNSVRIRKILLTNEEIQFRQNKFSDSSAVTRQKLSCTACGIDIKLRLVNENNVHPVLNVLMCNKCNHFFCNRSFGSEESVPRSVNTNYCGWCAKDKYLSTCISCTTKFCKSCIQRNTTIRDYSSVLRAIEKKEWKCIICESKPIWSQRALCTIALEHNKAMTKQLEDRRTRLSTTRSVRRSESLRESLTRRDSNENTVTRSTLTTINTLSPGRMSISHNLPGINAVKDCTKKYEASAVQSTIPQEQVLGDENSRKLCVICLENEACMVLYRCGHACLCSDCTTKLTENGDHQCPICRKIFTDAMKVYF